MNTLSIEGWSKRSTDNRSQPGGILHFRVDEQCHRAMERAEQALQFNMSGEQIIDVDRETLELAAAAEYGEITDTKFRVYLGGDDHRGHFHLVARRVSDDALVYSNSVMIDQLG